MSIQTLKRLCSRSTHTLPEQVLAIIARLNYLNSRAFDIAEQAREIEKRDKVS